ncbi:potassium inwardly-rectifying channel subfamily J member 15 [Fistulifera solaris]|uniref:Potassium inwardly-rectifying channel subfamily J member 15 n=1 Tax=Fistulifera solaris TaxID=1519565 RepID=A0A1Z5KPC9_FISSO|nr:potassium inwardly-rectifying channel subfamily J member 15 [Fistulifera solaris]|eukprot:GAX28146.1 potassium inwardly-rectifying channel subfamily J member 15 [Fistulifera solaris]
MANELINSPHYDDYDVDDDNASIETDTNISAVMWTDPLLPARQSTRQRRRQRRRLLDRHAIRHVEREQARSTTATTTTSFRHMQQTVHWWWNDWFHTLAYQRTTTLITYLFVTYVTLVLTFAGLYYTLSRTIGCEMDLHVLMEALYFSLSTQATIGYGVSDYYFGGCWTPFGLVLVQVWTALLFDAIAIGLIFQRLSRGHKRGKTVWFSRVACIRRVTTQGHSQWYLYIRLGEGRRHPLIQTQVRGYCVRHERYRETGNHHNSDNTLQTTHFVTRPLRWLESHVWMRLPQVLVHALDETSPLVPPKDGWYDAQGHWRSINDSSTFPQSLQEYWQDRQSELIVLLEGIDALTGSMSQTQHSYTMENIVWDAQFVPCVRPDTNGGCVVDFAQFHETRPVNEDTPCPYL